MKKLILGLLLLIPIVNFPREYSTYYQEKDQRGLFSLLGTIDASAMFKFSNNQIFFQSFGGAKFDTMYRLTPANVWGITSISIFAPTFKPLVPISPFEYFFSIGVGGFLFDHRDLLDGVGSYMTMSSTLFSPFSTVFFGIGVSIDTRYHYSFSHSSAFTIGLDISTRVANTNEDILNPGVQILSFALSMGFSFSSFLIPIYK